MADIPYYLQNAKNAKNVVKGLVLSFEIVQLFYLIFISLFQN